MPMRTASSRQVHNMHTNSYFSRPSRCRTEMEAAWKRTAVFVFLFIIGCYLSSSVLGYELNSVTSKRFLFFLSPTQKHFVVHRLRRTKSQSQGCLPASVFSSRGPASFSPALFAGPLLSKESAEPASEAGVYDDVSAAVEASSSGGREQNRRDHKTLGTTMDLFCFPKPRVAAMGGLGPALLPRGQAVMLRLQDALRILQREQGFEEVRTCSLAQAYLWRRSGHMKHFAENMYAIANPNVSADPIVTNSAGLQLRAEAQPLEQGQQGAASVDVLDTSYLLKPMSCPMHLSFFFQDLARKGSTLPIRISEFGHVFRREVPSALYGLLRMREFTQDDGHILCPMSQAKAEATTFLSGCRRLYKAVGFKEHELKIRLSTRPQTSQGSMQEWARAEELLRSALQGLGLPFEVGEGEGAFYGPKIDLMLPDVDGRLWQTGTLQRFLGLVLEHSQGHLKPWLAPTQVAVLSVGVGQAEAAENLGRRLRKAGVRVSVDTRPVHISRKLKPQLRHRTPEMWLLGTADQERNTVTLRRSQGKPSVVPLPRAMTSARRRSKMPF